MTDLAEPKVIVRTKGAVGRLTLNRPKALHALDTGMCRAMIDALLAWRGDEAVQLVVLDHAGERGFCAGGDIRMAAESGKGDGAAAAAFFGAEYQLNHLLFTYPKPIVAVMDGVTMGGGVGLSAPAPFRIATERTLYAMPESGIGLFPDVGGGWFLPRLPGKTGLWLGLTGARLKAADCLALSLATHYVPSDRLGALKAALAETPKPDAVLQGFAADPGPAAIERHRADIDRLFAASTLSGVLADLEADGSPWAAAQLAALKTKSPQTLAVTFRQMQADCPTFAENMAMEYRIAVRIARSPDFIEGVRAILIDKDNTPRWTPARIEELDPEAIESFFAPLPPGQEWRPIANVEENA